MYAMMVTNQKGFTLLELLVVLVIVGMAASFSGPQLWQSYAKASERSVLQVFSGALQKLRSKAIYTGYMIELPATDGGEKTKSEYFPAMPAGWELEQSSVLRMLPTGVTNGATFYFHSPSNQRWLISLQPFDGHVEIKRL